MSDNDYGEYVFKPRRTKGADPKLVEMLNRASKGKYEWTDWDGTVCRFSGDSCKTAWKSSVSYNNQSKTGKDKDG